MIPLSARVAFLRHIHLFHDLNEEQLSLVAERLSEQACAAGTQVFAENSKADTFYLIYRGRVRVTRRRRGEEEALATLVSGDYFGEEGLFTEKRRSATVQALEETLLFALPRSVFRELLKTFPKLRPYFEVSIQSRRLARQRRFKWLRKDEVVYFLARKHYVVLIDSLVLPVLLALGALGAAGWGVGVHSWVAAIGGTLLFWGMVGWGIWRAIDWGNDYYIVTNQRVVWLEKVVLLYDSRHEAPLTTVLSVGVETDFSGRLLDYGNVVVHTYVGKIPFNHVVHPHQAAHMVEEYWHRSRQSVSAAEKEAMRNVLRRKMGLTEKIAASRAGDEAAPAPVPSIYKPGLLKVLAARLFQDSRFLRVRFEVGGTITYRKHPLVLIKKAWLPATAALLFLAGMLVRALDFFWRSGRSGVDIVLLLMFLAFFYPLWRLIYEYLDWSNDIFQVTEDQIIDIDKKPFGTEERRAAPLENILSTEYRRLGLLGYLFNYGTVYITVGGSKLAFEDVRDPATVQQDIDNRRLARKARQEAGRAAAERERIADWFASYHENIGEIEKELEQFKEESE